MLDDLRALAATIESKSVTLAAERLCLTQSAVSRRLQHLEELLGSSLFDRTQRPPLPTALGWRVYERAIPILSAVSDILVLSHEDSHPSGTLRLGVTPAMGDTISADALHHIKASFPALDIYLRTEWSAGLSQQVLNGELDAAFVMMPMYGRVPPPLTSSFVSSVDLVIIGSSTTSSPDRPVPLSTLADEEWILNPVGCGYRSALESALGERGRKLRVAVDVFGADVQLRLVASGLGLGLVPKRVLDGSSNRHRIRILKVADFEMRLQISMISLGHLGNMKQALDMFAEDVSLRFTAETSSGSSVLES